MDFLTHSTLSEYDDALKKARASDRQKYIIDNRTGPKKKYYYQLAQELDISPETVKNEIQDLLDRTYRVMKEKPMELTELLKERYLKMLIINKEDRSYESIVRPDGDEFSTIDEYTDWFIANNVTDKPDEIKEFLTNLNEGDWIIYHRNSNIASMDIMPYGKDGKKVALFVRDIGKIYAKEETAVQRQAKRHDDFTGLLSKSAFEYDIAYEFKGLTGIVYADLNGLKKINDTYGHDAGDKAILRCAEILKMAFPNYDIYRVGGDEFVVAAFEVRANEFLNTVLMARGNLYFNDIAYGFSIDSASRVKETIEEAERKMYSDKRNRK